jgi:hypothetical protein
VLNPTFTIGGTVVLPDWSSLDYEGERRITIDHVRGFRSTGVVSLRAVEAGTWGPVRVPWSPEGSYHVRLEGSPIIPVDQSIERPAAGGQYSIDLVAGLGHSLYFVAETEQREVIGDAEVAAYFDVDGVAHVVKRRAGEDGYLIPWSFPDGVVVRAFISAPGFTGSWAEEVHIPETTPALHPVALRPSAVIHGRVAYKGDPVKDFRVLAWSPRLFRWTRVERTFLDREDGTFEFDGAPAGMIQVAAVTEGQPRTRPVPWQSPSSDLLELEILDGVSGMGQVVASDTGEPLRALVQPFYSTSEGPLEPSGQAIRCDDRGHFECAGFGPGPNAVLVKAPGYAERLVQADASEGAILQFGRIGLVRPQALEVRLVGDGGEEWQSYSIRGTGMPTLPGRSFDEDGIARWESVDPGRYDLEVTGPGFSWVSFMVVLEGGRDWAYSFRVSGGRVLHGEIVASTPAAVRKYDGIYVSYVTADGVSVAWGIPLPAGSTFSQAGIGSDNVVVGVYNKEQSVETVAELSADGTLRATIDLDAREFSLRVVDREGAPVPGVIVRVTDTEPTALVKNGTTDKEGETRLLGLPERDLLVHLEHATLGRVHNQRIDAREDGAELLLDCHARLELTLQDGDVPAAGVQGRILLSHVGQRWIDLGSSSEEGKLSAGPFGAGSYTIVIDGQEYWPVECHVEIAESDQAREVQIRRRGGLALLVLAGAGLPLAGMQVNLRSREFEQDVREWVSEGRVGGEGGLTTDANGRVVLTRLPRGPYEWSFTDAEGNAWSGEVEVLPGQITEYTARAAH